jgi:hypothetical protein
VVVVVVVVTKVIRLDRACGFVLKAMVQVLICIELVLIIVVMFGLLVVG